MINKDLVLKIGHSPKDELKGLKLPIETSPELAYLCGILVGDGSIYCRERKHEYVLKCVGNPKDEQGFYHEILGPCFEKVFGFSPEMRHYDSKTTFGFVVHSKALFKFLTEIIGLPFGKKYDSLTIPIIFKYNKELLINFIRGLVDTDGCISFKRRYKLYPYYPVISFASKNKNLVKEVLEELMKLDLKVVGIYDRKLIDTRVEKGFTVISNLELNGRDNLRKWLSLIGFFNPKHLEKIRKYWEK